MFPSPFARLAFFQTDSFYSSPRTCLRSPTGRHHPRTRFRRSSMSTADAIIAFSTSRPFPGWPLQHAPPPSTLSRTLSVSPYITRRLRLLRSLCDEIASFSSFSSPVLVFDPSTISPIPFHRTLPPTSPTSATASSVCSFLAALPAFDALQTHLSTPLDAKQRPFTRSDSLRRLDVAIVEM